VLTEKWLIARHRKISEKEDEVADRDGLSVRVSAKGKLVFQMRYTFAGTPKRLSLGSYPRLGLKEARELNDRLRKKLDEGHDPKVVVRVQKAEIRKDELDTLTKLFLDWYEKVVVKRKPLHVQIKRSFEIHVLPRYGELPPNGISLEQWLHLLEDLVVAAPTIADRILTNAKQMLKWGKRRERIKVNPLADITAKEDLMIQKRIATRALANEELVRVWLAIDRSHVRPINKLFLKLCLIYGCRYNELRKAEKSHFDFVNKIWTVPAANHKTGKKTKKPLLRPITPEIEPLILEAFSWSGEGEFLFAAIGSNKLKSASAYLCLPINLTKWLKKKEKYEIRPWSIKAFRKTARTNFSTLAQPHVAEIMLGHALPGSWQIYDLHPYLKEQADAYSAWCRRIMELIGANVLLGSHEWPRLWTFIPRTIERQAAENWVYEIPGSCRWPKEFGTNRRKAELSALADWEKVAKAETAALSLQSMRCARVPAVPTPPLAVRPTN
jgi:integrase